MNRKKIPSLLKRHWRLAILAVLFSASLISQSTTLPRDIKFYNSTIPGGLKENKVSQMTQDSFGFIWFPSSNGLHRFDGDQFRSYFFGNELDKKAGQNLIEKLIIDSDGNYWLGTQGNGIYKFDYIKGTFENYKFLEGSNSIWDNYILDMVDDPDGNLWITTVQGILAFDKTKKTFTRYGEVQINGNIVQLSRVESVILDDEGQLWFGAGDVYGSDVGYVGGLIQYVHETNTLKHVALESEIGLLPGALHISSMFKDRKGKIWIGTTNSALLEFDPRTEKIQNHEFRNHSVTIEHGSMFIPSITADNCGRLWFAVLDEGLYCYDPVSRKAKMFQSEPDLPFSLYSNKAMELFAAVDGTIWIAGGISGPYFRTSESFLQKIEVCKDRSYDQEVHVIEYFKDFQVTAIESDQKGKIWVGTQNNGLFLYDQAVGTAQSIAQLYPNFTAKHIKAVHGDQFGNIWVGCWPEKEGLFRLDPTNKEVIHYKSDPENPKTLSSDVIMDILEDQRGKLWIATWGGGINQFDPATKSFSRFLHNPTDSFSLGGDYAICLHEDRQGRIWVGGGGTLLEPYEKAFLDRYDPASNQFDHYFHLMENPVFPMADGITDIEQDQHGKIWLSKKGAIIRLDPALKEIKTFSPSLHSQKYLWFWNIDIDREGKIWATSQEALHHFNPKQQHFTPFPWRVLPIEKNWWQPLHVVDSENILAGGQDGMISISSQSILNTAQGEDPNIYVSELVIPGDSISGNKNNSSSFSATEVRDLVLRHNQNSFSFKLIAPYFKEKKIFSIEYKLEGHDLDWKTYDTSNEIAYFKLSPGKYQFKTRVHHLTGKISGPWTKLNVSVLSPWWFQWWAFILYGSVIIGLSFLFYRFQLKRRLAEQENQQLKELNDFKTRLYTNITHEFRTPLTVINGLTQEIKGFDREKQLILKNSNQLLSLIGQILSLQKLEFGKMQLNTKSGDIARFLNYLTESFQSVAEQKHLRLIYFSDPKNIPVVFDEEKIQQLVSNLISNAIKFTPDYGKVEVFVKQTNKGVKISVRDTGIGIAKTEQTRIFDRFYQVDQKRASNDMGSGIGLALVRELVHLMGGNIDLKSEVGKGSCFTLLLPLVQSDYDKEKGRFILDSEYNTLSFNKPAYSFSNFENKNTERFLSANRSRKHLNQILLVEDNMDVLYYLKGILEHQFGVETAKNGQEGLEKAIEEVPDLIISDVMMPEMDGFELCHILKNDERTSHIPIILLTAKATQEERLEGLKTGADAYLAKPFDKAELLIRIEKLLEVRKKVQLQFRHSISTAEMPTFEDPFLMKLQRIVAENLGDENFGTQHLCRLMGMSRTQLHRKIKSQLDIPTSRFIQKTRLYKARQLIFTSNKTISEISFETGFKDPSYFTKLYAAEFEETPSGTRK